MAKKKWYNDPGTAIDELGKNYISSRLALSGTNSKLDKVSTEINDLKNINKKLQTENKQELQNIKKENKKHNKFIKIYELLKTEYGKKQLEKEYEKDISNLKKSSIKDLILENDLEQDLYNKFIENYPILYLEKQLLVYFQNEKDFFENIVLIKIIKKYKKDFQNQEQNLKKENFYLELKKIKNQIKIKNDKEIKQQEKNKIKKDILSAKSTFFASIFFGWLGMGRSSSKNGAGIGVFKFFIFVLTLKTNFFIIFLIWYFVDIYLSYKYWKNFTK